MFIYDRNTYGNICTQICILLSQVARIPCSPIDD